MYLRLQTLLFLIVAVSVASSRNKKGDTDVVYKASINIDAVQDLASRWISRVDLLEQLRFEVLVLSENGDDYDNGNDKHDIFEYEAAGAESDVPTKVMVRGTTTAALTAGLGWYLKYECNVHISWTGDQLSSLQWLTALPIPNKKVRHRRNGKYSYYQNVCTVSYSSVWWDVDRWNRELDWMALSGINFPLAFSGQEIVWQQTFMELFTKNEGEYLRPGHGHDDINDDIKTWLGGPAFMAWQRMGNIQAWGGPMPQSWIDQQYELQKSILRRMVDLGIRPVLPAFGGFVPPLTKRYFPDAKISLSNKWGGFNVSYTPVNLVEPTDPLFLRIGTIFQKTYRRLYPEFFSETEGGVHYYNADTYNEMDPKHDELPYLRQASKAVFDSIRSVDSTGVWVMQGWLFASSGFWTKERMQAYLSGVDDESSIEEATDERLIILDLMSDVLPQYERSDYYFGKSYIYSMLHNFGGNHGLYGRMHVISNDPIKLFHDIRTGQDQHGDYDLVVDNIPSETLQERLHREMQGPVPHKNLEFQNNIQGVGLTMEGINQNFVVYDLLTEMSWRRTTGFSTDDSFLPEWIDSYVTRRYDLVASDSISSSSELSLRQAWQQLLTVVYTCDTTQLGVTKSVAVRRPRMENMTHGGFMPTAIFYDPKDLQVAWKLLLDAAVSPSSSSSSDGLPSLETYRYDLVDVTRQCLSDLLLEGQIELWQAYENRNLTEFRSVSTRFLGILEDLDRILSTHDLFLFETQWLGPARAAAGSSYGESGCDGDDDGELSAFYEFNAKNQVTMWGPEGEISDYASKQYCGLVSHYYHTRWSMFVDAAIDALRKGIDFDSNRFEEECKLWEKNWQHRHEEYPSQPVGDTYEVSVELYKKYIREYP